MKYITRFIVDVGQYQIKMLGNGTEQSILEEAKADNQALKRAIGKDQNHKQIVAQTAYMATTMLGERANTLSEQQAEDLFVALHKMIMWYVVYALPTGSISRAVGKVVHVSFHGDFFNLKMKVEFPTSH